MEISKDPSVIFGHIEDYISENRFDLYVVNSYTRPLVKDHQNVFEVEKIGVEMLENFLKTFPRTQVRILGIGAGTVVDAVKYICFKTNSTFCFAPSALSTNSFATHRNSFFEPQQGKISTNSAAVSEILVDIDLIEQAYILNKFGAVEIASTAVALVDCDIATKQNSETFDNSLKERAMKVAAGSVEVLSRSLSRESLQRLLNYLLESGNITRLHGSGRLVSGSEHIISSYIESEKACPHGMGLLFGILIAQQLQIQAGYADAIVDTIVEYLKQDTDMRKYIQSTATAVFPL